METVVSEIKRMGNECSELDKEVNSLQGDVAIQEVLLENLTKEHESGNREVQLMESLKDALDDHKSTISSVGLTIKKSHLMLVMLKKYIEHASPTSEEEAIKLEHLRNSHEEMLKTYEMNPTYKSIVEAERYAMELNELCLNKRNEIMDLEKELYDMVNVY